MALDPHNGYLEVVFSFDTTGSMYGYLEQVRTHIKDMIQRLQGDIPHIRIAVFAHGDYCDASTYVTKWIDFTNDAFSLCNFVSNVEKTGGGDAPECYELVLQQTRTKLSWSTNSRRVLVMIGDDEPHKPEEACNKDNIDWKTETAMLAGMGVTIYPVQCGRGSKDVNAFYETLAQATGGKHLKLDNFGHIFDVLMAVCYREGNDTALFSNYENEVRSRCGAALGRDIDAIFNSLRDTPTGDGTPTVGTPLLSATAPTKPSLSKTKSLSFTKKPPCAKRLPVKSPLRRKSNTKTQALGLLHRYKLENLSLLRREKVPNTNFKLNDLAWSPWKMVMAPENPQPETRRWVKRRGMPGYRLRTVQPKSLKHNDNKYKRVLFEVSVQTPGTKRLRHNVVFSSFSTRCFDNTAWEYCVLRRVRDQINKMVDSGCHIFMRFYKLSVRDDLATLRKDLGRYDYAWKTIRNVRPTPRLVKSRSGFEISSIA